MWDLNEQLDFPLAIVLSSSCLFFLLSSMFWFNWNSLCMFGD
uniref:Uncharacterized protein n=1 Tax=Rhizophora mucronata TaxID=61149 RepID=A0A2P2PGN2_RHIMU